MKISHDLKYVGANTPLDFYSDSPWHCTCCSTSFNTGEPIFTLQKPYYHNNIFVGYTQLDSYTLTEDELVANFKIIKDDGSLEKITHSNENIELQNKLNKENIFENMTKEDLEKFLEKY